MKKIIIVLQLILIIGIIVTFTGCNGNSEDTKQAVSKEDITNDVNNIEEAESLDPRDEKAKQLANTCPNNLQCTSPSCGSWSDINKDGVCDRGVNNE